MSATPSTQTGKPTRRRTLKPLTALPGSGVVWASADTVMDPVPPFMADFLHHMQGELIKASSNAPEPGSIVLQPHAPLRWDHCAISSRGYDPETYRSVSRCQRHYQTRYWPAWELEEERSDDEGGNWRRERYCTVDDFGTLVPVRRGFDDDAIWGAYA